MPFARAGTIDLFYEAAGSGSPVVFIHGGNGNTLSWFQQIPFFAQHHRCIAVDLRTFHRSACPPDLYHPRHFVDDLEAVFHAAGIGRAVLVCQSVGAWAGLPFALRFPERVAGLVISSSPTPLASDQNARVLQRSLELTRVARQNGDPPHVNGLCKGFAEANPAMSFLYDQLSALNGPRNPAGMRDIAISPSALQSYGVPTLVTGGAHDHFLTPDHHEHIASLIPGARAHAFAHSGHSAFFEEPAAFNQVVRDFILSTCGDGR